MPDGPAPLISDTSSDQHFIAAACAAKASLAALQAWPSAALSVPNEAQAALVCSTLAFIASAAAPLCADAQACAFDR